jgi:hypothetical protein
VPPPLRGEFSRRIFSDAILQASAGYLLTSFPRLPQGTDQPPDPWQHNTYVATYLRGLLQLNDFEQRVRSHHGDPELIAQRMAQQISLVAFWMPRSN